jgi:hypothetical protein
MIRTGQYVARVGLAVGPDPRHLDSTRKILRSRAAEFAPRDLSYKTSAPQNGPQNDKFRSSAALQGGISVRVKDLPG